MTMRRTTNIQLFAGLILGLLVSAPAWAQRPLSAKFDLDTEEEMTGIVSGVDWRNPQGHIFINVGEGSDIQNWAIEIESPSILEMDGWNAYTVRPGDHLMVRGPLARNGTRQIWAEELRFVENGQEVFPKLVKPSKYPLSPRPAPRWPDDGHAALGAIPGIADGYWTDPSETMLMEDGVEDDIEMTPYGLLENLDEDAEAIAPMQEWALALFKLRQETELQSDPMFQWCKPPGGLRQYQSRLGFQLIEDRKTERIFVLIGSGNHNYRIIFLDGRDPVGQQGGDDDNPLYYGRSVGEWQGDTLVVETSGFNEDFWFTNGGLPHTSLMKLTERFTRVDFDTLRYEVEVDDPGAYTRSWSASWTLKWNGGEILPTHFCQNNRP